MFLCDQRPFKMAVSLSHGEYITADSIEDLHQQKTPQGAENETSALKEQATTSIISNLCWAQTAFHLRRCVRAVKCI